jgi:uncharacterized membrane protein (DUF373 family)
VRGVTPEGGSATGFTSLQVDVRDSAGGREAGADTMSDDEETATDSRPAPPAEPSEETIPESITDQYTDRMDGFVRFVEIAAASVFAILFAVGVIDLGLQILEAVESGEITDPLVVIGFIDTGLLLLIIVEVYQTVRAYVQEDETRIIVRLVVYTGIIAMVRKVIIFRVGEYQTVQDALTAALSYTAIILGLIGLLLAEQVVEGSLPVIGD